MQRRSLDDHRRRPRGGRRALHLTPPLFRRREVWLPTLWGWATLLIVLLLAAAAVARSLPALLVTERPAHGPAGQGARTLVVEGWMLDPEIVQAARIAQSGRYERVLTTGGPLMASMDARGYGNDAVRAAAVLRAAGLTQLPITPVPAPPLVRDRTFQMASSVRDWAQRSGVRLEAIDLVSTGMHVRRSGWIYRLALGPSVEVGTFAVRPADYDAQRWWASSEGAKHALEEVSGLAWTACCLWP